ncbi:MAG: formate dehydrogenase subunit alpha, partial [Chloroflexi bacterium]|nr:formate dehydrogenase subunit alpha [Chloroflexota bacterium]
QVIIKERLYDEEFVSRRTDNFDELATNLNTYTPKYVQNITGITAQDVQLAARLFAEVEKASIVYGNGITQHANGTNSVTALANLAMLTGNIGHSRGGIFVLQRENNAQGACDMGSLPDFLPGYQALDNVQAKKIYEERWGASLPANTGLTALEMIEQATVGKLKGMLIVGENPALSFPSPSRVKKALASLEFLVVSDMFLTETAKLATVVLPAASFAEKEGTFTNFEGRVQQVRKAIRPPGDSLPDWKIVERLADKMGHPMRYSSPQQIMDEIEELVPLYQPLAYANFEKEDVEWADLESGRLGERRLYKGLFPSGFGRFTPVEYIPLAKVSQDGYPMTLLTGSILFHFGSGTRSMRASRLKKFSPHGWVELNMADAEKLGFGEGDVVRVVSLIGEVATTIKVTAALPQGILFMPASFADSPVNELFDIAIDSQTKAPPLKVCAVRLERIGVNG